MPVAALRTLALVAAAAVGVALSGTAGPTPPAPPTPRPIVRAVATLLPTLRAEATAIARDRAPVPARPDLPQRFEIDLDVAAVTTGLVRPASSDPFVDAYTRWQLTSLAPPRPTLEGRAFEQFLRDLPRVTPNPWAATETVRRFDALRDAGPIPPARMAAVEAMIAGVAARATRARHLARPALEFRTWLIASAADDPGTQLALMLEHLGAMIAAGWDVEPVKATIGARCEAIGRDRDVRLTAEARDRIERLADAIAGRRAVVVANPSVSGGVLSFDVRDAAVYDFEIRAWLRALETHRR